MILRKGDFCFAKIVDKPFYCKQTLASRFLFTASCEWFLLAASGHLHTSRLPRHVENTARQSHRPQLVRELAARFLSLRAVLNARRSNPIAHNLPTNLVIARKLAMRTLSLRWNVVTEAIPLPTDRHTTFAMTTLILSLRWNVVTEAISSQATLVFGLLRYARNDKKTRWPRRLTRHLAMTILHLPANLVIAME